MSVEDATIALKGILGISNSNTTPPVPDDAKKAQTPPKDSKKKNKKKQTKQTAKSTPKPSDNKSSSKKNNHNNASVKKSRGKKNEDAKTEAENYAWSSFQSPPDASSLPLPAFGSLNDGFNQAVQDSSTSENQPSGLDLSDVADSDGRNDVTGISISSLAISHDSKDDNVHETKLNQFTPDSKKLENEPGHSQNLPPKIEEPSEPSDPLAMLMYPTYGTAVKNTPSKSVPTQSLQYQPQQAYMQSPLPFGHSHFHGPMSPQPSFVSIQVQVPPNLLPGRRMMVHTNPSQPPFTVVVPEGIQPGMFMPVTVPMHMYNMGPMMSPPHSMHPGQFQPGPSMGMNHFYQQNGPVMNGQFSSPQGGRKPVPPPEGSWAAKVAASQQST
jgi:hypothetical protein